MRGQNFIISYLQKNYLSGGTVGLLANFIIRFTSKVIENWSSHKTAQQSSICIGLFMESKARLGHFCIL